MLAYLAVAILAVCAWEVARVLLRAARPIPEPVASAAPPPSEIFDAHAEAVAFRAPGGQGDGLAAFKFVCNGDEDGVGRLSPARRAWLRALTDDERAALRRAMPDRIGRHMNRQTTIRGVGHVQPLQPVTSFRDVVERVGTGGGPRRPR